MTDEQAIERIVRPIVEGQLRTFAHAHPVVVNAVDWDHSGKSKFDTFVDSAAKRVVRALLCPETVARLRSASTNAGKSDGGEATTPFAPPRVHASAPGWGSSASAGIAS